MIISRETIRLDEKLLNDISAIQNANYWKSIIFHIPHASLLIPEEYRDQFVLSDEELELEQMKLVDRHTEDLFGTSVYEQVVFPVSRIVCDPERFKDDREEPIAVSGMGAVYTKTSDGRDLRRTLTDMERQSLIKLFYDAHYRRIRDIVHTALFENGRALILDCHSFPSQPFPYESETDSQRPDVCIGTDSYHTPQELTDRVGDYFEKNGYAAACNYPYSGSFVPSPYYRRNKKVESVMLEINRSLYMDEKTGEKTEGFETVREALAGLWEVLLEYVKQ